MKSFSPALAACFAALVLAPAAANARPRTAKTVEAPVPAAEVKPAAPPPPTEAELVEAEVKRRYGVQDMARVKETIFRVRTALMKYRAATETVTAEKSLAPAPDVITPLVVLAALDADEANQEKIAATAREAKAVADKAAADAAKATADTAKLAAEVSATTALTAKNAAQNTVDDLKSGRLMRLGLAIGVAATTQIGTGWGAAKVLSYDNMQMTPFIGLYPGFWGQDSATTTYCATSYSGDRDAARAAANHRAADALRARAVLLGDKDLAKNPDDDVLLLRANQLRLNESKSDYWDPSKGAKCWFRRIGLYVAYPSSYTATVAITELGGESSTAVRDVKPRVSFGLVYSPHAFISILAGLTVSAVHQSAPVVDKDGKSSYTGTDKDHYLTAWSWGLGIGGNTDIINALLGQ